MSRRMRCTGHETHGGDDKYAEHSGQKNLRSFR
jgi:hypothetical protein